MISLIQFTMTLTRNTWYLELYDALRRYTEKTVLLKYTSKNLTNYRSENNFVGPSK